MPGTGTQVSSEMESSSKCLAQVQPGIAQRDGTMLMESTHGVVMDSIRRAARRERAVKLLAPLLLRLPASDIFISGVKMGHSTEKECLQ